MSREYSEKIVIPQRGQVGSHYGFFEDFESPLKWTVIVGVAGLDSYGRRDPRAALAGNYGLFYHTRETGAAIEDLVQLKKNIGVQNFPYLIMGFALNPLFKVSKTKIHIEFTGMLADLSGTYAIYVNIYTADGKVELADSDLEYHPVGYLGAFSTDSFSTIEFGLDLQKKIFDYVKGGKGFVKVESKDYLTTLLPTKVNQISITLETTKDEFIEGYIDNFFAVSSYL